MTRRLPRVRRGQALNIAQFLLRFDGVKPEGPNAWRARCPAHDDADPSLVITDAPDKILVFCRSAGCSADAVVAKVGLTMADLFHDDKGAPPAAPRTVPAQAGAQPRLLGPLSLDSFAKEKGFEPDLLRDHGWYQDGDILKVRYFDRAGRPWPKIRVRSALAAKDGSMWSGEGEVIPYGRHRLDDAMEKGELILCEGETDALACWAHGAHALGIPGANMVGKLAAEDLDGIETLWIVQEPDQGGLAFVRGCAKRLADLDWQGTARVLRLPGAKDLHALHMAHPDGFTAALAEAQGKAIPLAEEGARDLEVTQVGDDLDLSWPDQGVTIRMECLRETGRGVEAEVRIDHPGGRETYSARLNLSRTSERETLVKTLERRAPVEWGPMIDAACRITSDRLRLGEPVEDLDPAGDDESDTLEYLVEPIIPLGKTSVLYGDGSSGKSYLALAMALAYVTGKALTATIGPRQPAGRVLILDWETNKPNQRKRLRRLCRGLGIGAADIAGKIKYRRMTTSLATSVRRIRAIIAEHGIGLVIVDSLVPACGAEPETADSALRALNAANALAPATRLVIAHVNKADAAKAAPATPFGSVFVKNIPRMTWEARRSDEPAAPDTIRINLFNRKANDERLLPPIGLSLDFSDGQASFHGSNIADVADQERTSLSGRILQALNAGPMTAEAIQEYLGGKDNLESIKATLRRLRASGRVTRLQDGRWAVASVRAA